MSEERLNEEFKGLITKEDYILTNWWVTRNGEFAIRLKDEKEYPVYFRKIDGKKVYYIKKENGNYKLDDEVKKWFVSEIRVYEREGI